MLNLITRLTTKLPWLMIAFMLVLMSLAGVVGHDVVGELSSGGFDYAKAPSYLAEHRLSDTFGQKPSNALLLITAKQGTVDSPAVSEAGLAAERLFGRQANVTDVYSYWSAGRLPQLRSTDSRQALVIGSIAGSQSQAISRVAALIPIMSADTSLVRVQVGGAAAINQQFSVQIEKDLKFAESIAFPVILIVLLLVFRSVVAALLPLLIGGFSILLTLLVLHIMTKFTTVSIYSLNLTTMMGLGLAIDYSLFIISRFREQLARGDTVPLAVGQTIYHAGRTVLFSALTVAMSLAALVVFPQAFLRSFAFAGTAVALTAAAGALLLLPAVLRVLGHRINALPIGRQVNYEKGSRTWHRIASFVMRWPLPIAATIIVALVLLGLPSLSINLGSSDERALPAGNPARKVQADIRSRFASQESAGIIVVSQPAAKVTLPAVDRYAASLSRLAHVDHVEAASGTYARGVRIGALDKPGQYNTQKGTWLSVVPNVTAVSAAGENTVTAVRASASPFPVYVGGVSADVLDLKQSVIHRSVWALLWIAAATIILLFLMFGSVIIPIKAIVISVLSLSAVFGAIVWIFQEGHLAGLLHFTATGVIDATIPILMFCVAFGLSMDYEVFLLSRIKEQHDLTHDNTASVATGLEKTGGIVTAAAFSISVVFLAFATSGVMIIKMFGLGLALAVLLDAFVIRATLIPAFMRLVGEVNWWAPAPLRRLFRNVHIPNE